MIHKITKSPRFRVSKVSQTRLKDLEIVGSCETTVLFGDPNIETHHFSFKGHKSRECLLTQPMSFQEKADFKVGENTESLQTSDPHYPCWELRNPSQNTCVR